MTTLRRRFLRWLILRFGADMTIVQNVTISRGTIHVPDEATHSLVRGVVVQNTDTRATPAIRWGSGDRYRLGA